MKAVSAEAPRTASRYAMIYQVLRDAIIQGTALQGLVLLEAPLADLFGTSRVPVRRALHLLYEEALISRFDGRGYLINPQGIEIEPLRLPLSAEHLGLETGEERVDTRPLGERIYEEIGAALSTCIAFGHYRLDEQAAAQHYGVSRAVVREALMRLRDRGLVEKEPYSQWLAGPLTAREVTEDYELRACLEPEALRLSAPALDRERLEAMLQRVLQAQQAEHCSLEEIERIEEDLHQQCLDGLQNRKMAALIRQAQSPMIINRIFYQLLGIGADQAMLAEHRLILELLLHGAFDAAALNLKEHLQRSRQRMLQRLKVLSVVPEPSLPGFLSKIS
ncbi:MULTISPECIES: GntR family transcriptional regulator [unclassified Pseudomonas]|uniref:GntR family transcriptional regulator n=1 Tax=unclassified Pseudomonas TaxID=196821 RepID=UPI002AC8E22D|nr:MULTISPECIES: GntR family transcriptional regulator [unclassified Pseudomonas]MEB0046715.1 GntR family transcriptional regulator [Pseudomonas sp. Dout3]MEB0098597.1 GntR family transcriptional regulator [Pseudomonas sp. DC1.2]WPX56631.1 GntR family transcriptional regulator [Pseudomonas sp. DC1.2]